MIKFSIIIPVYNSEHFLKECIDSILNQCYQNIEIILVNDGSTDSSLEICNNYSTMDSRIIVIDKKNGGVSSARNSGLKIASGDYILFVDSDDKVMEGIFEFAINILYKNELDLLKFSYNSCYGLFKKMYTFNIPVNRVINKHEYKKLIYNKLFNTNDFGNIWNCFFNKKIIKQIVFDESLKYGEDRKFMFDNLMVSDNIYASSQPYYNYLININGAMNKKSFEKAVLQVSNSINVNIYMFKKLNLVEYRNYLIESAKYDFTNLFLQNCSFKSFKTYINFINKICDNDLIKPILIYFSNDINLDFKKNYSNKTMYIHLKFNFYFSKFKSLIKKKMIKGDKI